ncbi:agarase [Cellvibrio sp. KY-GH-1]|nr:agarase [Cellvibrio sp. KY-GH-1]
MQLIDNKEENIKMKKLTQRKLFYILTLTLFSTSIFAQPTPPAGKMWQKQSNLSDDFNSGFDTSKWQKPLWNYGEPVNMVAENSGVSNGNLWIKGTLGTGARWFNGSRVMSNAQIKYPYYTEARIKSANISAYSTFWLNNGDINNRDEIDIIENNPNPSCNCQPNFPWQMNSQYFHVVNGDTQRAHGNFDNRNLPDGAPGKGVRWNEAYFTFGVWQKDARNIQFYLNGYPAGSVVSARDFTRDMNIIWDLWTADFSWLGGLAVQSQLNDVSMNTMYVDWINTYKLVDGVASSSSSSSAQSSSSANSSVASGATQTIDFANYFDTGKATSAVAGDTIIGFNKSGGGNINYNSVGDWGDYLVTLPTDGQYKIEIVTASPMTSGIGAKLSIDGIAVGTITLGTTGDWETYTTTTLVNNLSIGAGTHTLRIESTGTSAWQWNGDVIRVTKVGSDPIGSPVTPTPVSMTLQAENFAATGGVYDGFKIYTVNGVSAVNYNQRGDWANYTVNVAADGNYSFNAYVSSPMTGAALEVTVDGVKVLTQAVPNNGSWDNFQKISSSNKIALTKGTHTIRVASAGTTASTWEWNADKFELVP